jgi:hypothetical protein
VKTDLSIAIPVGTYARVAPRSGLAWKHSIDVGAGIIDADYRGPVGVILFNHSDTDFTIQAGDRIAQLILQLIITPQVLEVEDLDTTTRGEGGFGSTGIVALVVDPWIYLLYNSFLQNIRTKKRRPVTVLQFHERKSGMHFFCWWLMQITTLFVVILFHPFSFEGLKPWIERSFASLKSKSEHIRLQWTIVNTCYSAAAAATPDQLGNLGSCWGINILFNELLQDTRLGYRFHNQMGYKWMFKIKEQFK